MLHQHGSFPINPQFAMRFTSSLLILTWLLLSLTSFVSSKLIPIPGGYLPSECVHGVPSGSTVERLHDGTVKVHTEGLPSKTLPKCSQSLISSRKGHGRKLLQFPPSYDGWTAYTAFQVEGTFDSFLGDFSVPDMPAQMPEILYLFTGLQNIDWVPLVDPEPAGKFDIIQPVLQYPADTGAGWSVKSWYVTLDVGAVYSTELLVNVGDVIFGNMTRLNTTGWFIGSQSTQTGQSTNLVMNANRLTNQPWAYNTLEMYGAVDCSTYPTQPVLFSKLSLTTPSGPVTPTWAVNPQNQPTKFCHELPTVNSDGTVTITFQ